MKMKKFIFLTFLMLFTKLYAYEAPETPGDWCDGVECTSNMKNIMKEFNKAKSKPFIVPGMYSGECYYLSDHLGGDVTHYIGVLFDNHPAGGLYMAPIFQFFGESNDMKDWSLAKARTEMSPDWLKHGNVTQHKTSFTASVLDDEGYPVYVYWARQNKKTNKLYFLVFMRQWANGFCEARLNQMGSF
jgi:hypothetical protein